MTMTNLMNELISEAQEKAKGSRTGGAGAWRDTEHGKVHVTITPAEYLASDGGKVWRKNWTLNGKKIAAKKLEAL